MELEAGAVLEGKVTSITKFGAFVALPGGGSGLVHISEIANTYVSDVHDHLTVGQSVQVRVLKSQGGKVDLSIKKALPPPPGGAVPRRSGPPPGRAPSGRRSVSAGGGEPPPTGKDAAFEDKLKQFLSSSERKMADLNRNISGKQGGRRRR